MVVRSFPKVSETFLVDKFVGLLARGVDVHLVTEVQHPHLWPHFELLADPSLRRRVHGRPTGNARWRLPLTLCGRLLRAGMTQPLTTLRAILQEGTPDLLATPGRLALAAKIFALQPDIVHFEFGNLAAQWIQWKPLFRAPVVVSFRGFDLNFFGLEQPAVYDEVWDAADGLHFLGRDLKERAERRGWTGSGVTKCIPPAVDTDFFSPSRDAPKRGGTGFPLRLLSVGRLHWKKGYEYALTAIRQLEDSGVRVQYRIVGGGPFQPAVQACVRDLGLDHVVDLLGDKMRKEIRAQMQWADMFLHAAVSEGFCNAVLEAQSMALPVVCTDADGLAENVVHGETGFVVGRRSPPAMCEALRTLATQPGLCRRMGAAGRARAQSFTQTRQLDAFADLYRRVIETQ